MAKIISGKELSAKLKLEMADEVKTFPAKYGRVPHLVVILVGEDPGSVSYVTGKAKASAEVGIRNTTIRKPESVSEAERHDLENAFRGAGERAGLFLPQRRNVQGMEVVDILLFVDGGDHLVLVDMFRKGQLDQNAVHLVVEVQGRDDVQQFGLGNGLGLSDRGIADAHSAEALALPVT